MIVVRDVWLNRGICVMIGGVGIVGVVIVRMVPVIMIIMGHRGVFSIDACFRQIPVVCV
ncbi:MAG: hypothetical protein ACF787_00035 [Rhodopirellula sp. JB053]